MHARILAILIGSLCLLTMPGCGHAPAEQAPLELKAQPVADRAARACPQLDPVYKAEAARGAPPTPHQLSDDANKRLHDAAEAAIRRKNGLLRQLAREYDACVGGKPVDDHDLLG